MGSCASASRHRRRLAACTRESCTDWYPPKGLVKVLSVYDGDTLTVAAPIHGHIPAAELFSFRIRLAGIDAPELRTHDAGEKRAGQFAAECLREHVIDKLVWMEPTREREMYGRVLARINVDGGDVATWMLTRKLALPYDGKTKREPIGGWLHYVASSPLWNDTSESHV